MKKTMKMILLTTLLVGGVSALSACGNNDSGKIKVGLIALHDSNSTYDKNFIDAFKAACKTKGMKAVIETGVPESSEVTNKADDMVDKGCKFIFADSFGHESHLLESAKKAPDVQFAHATGTKAHTENQANFHNAFASIYEGRYLAGVAAGLKLKDMMEKDATIQPKIGYVGAFDFAEVKSGYTSYFLGVKSIVNNVTMDVKFTKSWYDETEEKSAADSLIKSGCKIISQHADSMGAPTACETNNVPNVSYNGSTKAKAPNTYLVSSRINWEPYFEYCFDAIKNGTKIDTDWTGKLGDTIYDGSVCLSELGNNIAPGTEEKLNEVHKQLKDGSLKVFDCSKFTVNGEHITSYMANVDDDPAYAPDTEAVVTENNVTYFAESSKRSAPYFDLSIDGITMLNEGH